MMLRDFFVPPGFDEPPSQRRQHESLAPSGLSYEAATLAPSWLAEFAERFRRPAVGFKQGSKAWQQRAIKAWCQVADDWQTRKFLDAKPFFAALSAATGLSQKMLQEAVSKHFYFFDEALIKEWLKIVRREREAQPECRRHHPALAFLVAAGNLPGVAILPVVHLSLLGIPTLVKSASAEPFLLPAILTTLANYDPEVAARLAVFNWPRSASELTQAVTQHHPALAAFGDDGTMRQFAQYQQRFADFGDRFSLAIIEPDGIKSTASAVAYDVCMFEQMGCLSPQAIFLLTNDWNRVEAFCRHLAGALGKMSEKIPVNKRTPAQHAAVQQWRGALAARDAASEKVILLTSAGTDWTVAAAEHFDLDERVAYRFARVWPVPSLAEAMPILQQYRSRLQALALGSSLQERQKLLHDFPDLENAFSHTLKTIAGYMQVPAFDWLDLHPEWRRLTRGLRREAEVEIKSV
ncbi:MAG: acyl-CoA reductase [bacterium]